jgi:hypothetical protein
MDQQNTIPAGQYPPPAPQPPQYNGTVPPSIDIGETPPPPKKSNKKLWIIILIVAIVLCCCCVVVVGIVGYQQLGNYDLNTIFENQGYLPILTNLV